MREFKPYYYLFQMGLHAYSFLSSGTDLLSTSTTHREDGDFSAFHTFFFWFILPFFRPSYLRRADGAAEGTNGNNKSIYHSTRT